MDIYKMKINGVSEIESPLDIKKDYSICLKRCSVKSITKTDTGEEDCIYTHNLENVDITTIIDEGRTIKGEPKSASKKIRGAIFHLGEELGIEDSEKFYQDMAKKIILNIDKIYEM
jgi:hypothetical protein